jgi:hypothetical protein
VHSAVEAGFDGPYAEQIAFILLPHCEVFIVRPPILDFAAIFELLLFNMLL